MREYNDSHYNLNNRNIINVNTNNGIDNAFTSNAQATPSNTGLIIPLALVGILLLTAVILLPIFLSKKANKDKFIFPDTATSTTTPTTTPTTLITLPNITTANSSTQKLTTFVDGKNVTYFSKYIINATNELELNGGVFNSTYYGENIFLVTDGTLKLKGVKLNKTGNYELYRRLMVMTTEQEADYFGINSVITVINNGRVEIEDCEIYSDSFGSSGVHVSETGYAEIAASSIYTVQENSKGLYSTYNGTISSQNTIIATEGDNSECIGTGVSSGNINCTDMSLETFGYDSPLIYSTGNVSISDSTGNAESSSIIIAESIPEPEEIFANVYSSDFIGGISDETKEDNYGILSYYSYEDYPYEGEDISNYKTPIHMILESSTFSIDESSNVYNETPMFGILNCKSDIVLNRTNFSYGSGDFINMSYSDAYGEPYENYQPLTSNLDISNSDGNLGKIYASSYSTINFTHDSTVSEDNYTTAGDGEINVESQTFYYEDINGNNVGYRVSEQIFYEDQVIESKTLTNSIDYGESVMFIVTNGVTLTMNNLIIRKTCRNLERRTASETVVTEYYDLGTNSAIVVLKGGKAILNNVTIYTDCYNSNGITAINGGEVEINFSNINTENHSSRGLHVAYDGKITARNIIINTKGDFSECIGNNRLGGPIDASGMTLNTEGSGSPLIKTAGDIIISDSNGTASNSRIAYINDKGNIKLNNCQFNCAGIKNEEDESNSGIYFTNKIAEDLGTTGGLEAIDSTLKILESSSVYNSAPVFYIKNLSSIITLDNTETLFGSDLFLNASGTEDWKERNTNDGIVNLNVKRKTIYGRIIGSNYLPVNFTYDSSVSESDYVTEGEVYVTSPGNIYNENINGNSYRYIASEQIYYQDQVIESKDFTSTFDDSDSVIFIVPDGTTLTLNNVGIKKTCHRMRRRTKITLIDYIDVGINSAIVVLSGGKAILNNVTINTNCPNSNAISAINGGVVEIRDSVIDTEKDSSRGLHVAYNGEITAENVIITTKGEFSECIGNNRLGGPIDASGMTLNTEGSGSPLIKTAGNIIISDSSGTASNSRIAYINDKGNIKLNNCQFNCAGIKNEEDESNSGIYFTNKIAEDLGTTGEFEAIDSILEILESSSVYNSAPVFYIKNLSSIITLDNTENLFGSDLFLNASGTEDWKERNTIDGIVNLNVKRKTISGRIIGNDYLPVNFTYDSSVSENDYTTEGEVYATKE